MLDRDAWQAAKPEAGRCLLLRLRYLSDDLARQARAFDATHQTSLKRQIFVGSMGIYGKVPGEQYRSILDSLCDSAAAIEQSELDDTILKPGWLNREGEVLYQIMQKSEAFWGHDVSLDSPSDLIIKLATAPAPRFHSGLGANRA